jgi:septal ring factor EnvC (AmiA/AmiB activator)
MKKLILFFLLFASPAFAQQQPSITPSQMQKLSAAIERQRERFANEAAAAQAQVAELVEQIQALQAQIKALQAKEKPKDDEPPPQPALRLPSPAHPDAAPPQ